MGPRSIPESSWNDKFCLSFRLTFVLLVYCKQFWQPKVNVMTGRQGYFRRVQATDKTVQQTVELHTGEIELEEGTADAIYNNVTKQTMPSHDALAIDNLPFFKMLSGSNQLALSAPADGGDAGQVPGGDQLIPIQNEPEQPHDSDDDADAPGMKGIVSSMAFALPAAKAKALATRAKAKAKQTPLAKTKSEPKPKKETASKKRKHEDEESLVTTLSSKGTSSKKSNSGDAATIEEFKSKRYTLCENFLKEINDVNDTAVTDSLRKGIKELIRFNQSIKAKVKSYQRRKDDPVELREFFDALIDEITTVQSFFQTLASIQYEDGRDLIAQFKEFKEMGWVMDQRIILSRCFKCIFTNQLKFGDWNAMCTTTFDQVCEMFPEPESFDFFEKNVNETVQRVLRSIPPNKVPWLWFFSFYG